MIILGHLHEALNELTNGIDGYGKILIKDWKQLAIDRLIVEQTIKILKANSILRHSSNK